MRAPTGKSADVTDQDKAMSRLWRAGIPLEAGSRLAALTLGSLALVLRQAELYSTGPNWVQVI